MINCPVLNFFIILAIIALSEFISDKSKSLLPSLFIGSIIFFILFSLGFPKTVFKDSGILGLSQLAMSLIIAHQGTTINFKELMIQWKTVIIALFAEIGIVVFVFFIGQMIWGIQVSAGATAPMGGGIVSAMIIAEVANLKGLQDIANISILVLILSMVIGYPICSYSLKQFIRTSNFDILLENTKDIIMVKQKFKLPSYFNTPYLIILRLSAVAVISFFIDYFTNSILNKYVLCLLLSIVFTEVGLLEPKSLDSSHSKSILMIIIVSVIYFQITYLSLDNLVSNLSITLLVILFGLVGISLFTLIASLLLKVRFWFAFSLGCSALFGFPGTQVVTEEVIRNSNLSDKCKLLANNYILPKMIVSGFVSVTITSVVLATIFSKIL